MGEWFLNGPPGKYGEDEVMFKKKCLSYMKKMMLHDVAATKIHRWEVGSLGWQLSVVVRQASS